MSDLLHRMNDSVTKAELAADSTFNVLTGPVDVPVTVDGISVPSLATRVRDYLDDATAGQSLDGADGASIETITIESGNLMVKLTGQATAANLGPIVPDDGVGIQTLAFNDVTGELDITLTSGEVIALGKITGQDASDVADAYIQNGNLKIQLGSGAIVDAGDITQFGGISANGADITEAGDLVILYTDGTVETVGHVVGARGKDGTSVVTGYIDAKGSLTFLRSDSTSFSVGPVNTTILDNAGNSVEGATITAGELILSLTNGDLNVGQVRGTDGAPGLDGADGADGVGISNVQIVDGELSVTLTNDFSFPVGSVTNTVVESADVLVTEATINTLGELELVISVNGVAQNANVGRVVGLDGTDGVDGTDGTIFTSAKIVGGVLTLVDSTGAEMSAGSVNQVSVTGASIDQITGDLTLTLSDSTTINAGQVRGTDGVDGIGVSGAYMLAGELYFTFDDPAVADVNVGSVMAPVETDAVMDLNNELTITLSDGQTFPLGSVRGADGTYMTAARIEAGKLVIDLSDGTTGVIVGNVEQTPVAASVTPTGTLKLEFADATFLETTARVQARDGDTIESISFDGYDLKINVSTDNNNSTALITVPAIKGRSLESVTLNAATRVLTIDADILVEPLTIDVPAGRDGDSITGVAFDGTDLTIDTNLETATAGVYEQVVIPAVKGKTIESVSLDANSNIVFEVSEQVDPIVLETVKGIDGNTITAVAMVGTDLVISMSDMADVIVPTIRGENGDTIESIDVVDSKLVINTSLSATPLEFAQIKGIDATESITDIYLSGTDLVIVKPLETLTIPAVKGVDGVTIENISVVGTTLTIDVSGQATPLEFEQIVGVDGRSITDIAFNGTDLVISTNLDATPTVTIPAVKGEDAATVASATINPTTDELIIAMSDTTPDYVIPGVGAVITSAAVDATTGQLKLTLSNGEVVTTTESVKGRDGNGTGVVDANFLNGALTLTLADAAGTESSIAAGDVSMVSVTGARIDETELGAVGTLVLTLSDATEITVGNVYGDDGRFVETASIVGNELILNMNDGTTINAGNTLGAAGRSIDRIEITPGGDMVVYYDDDAGTIELAGNIGTGAGLTIWDSLDAPYAKDRVVIHEGGLYLSLIDANSDVPPSANWTALSFGDQIVEVRTPVIVAPMAGASAYTTRPRLEASPYAAIVSSDARSFREFQVDLTTGDFSVPVYSAQVDEDIHEVTTDLTTSTSYKWRVRDVSDRNYQSLWSAVEEFSVPSGVVATPTVAIHVDEDATSALAAPRFTTSAFSNSFSAETHAQTDWEVYKVSDGSLVYSSLADTTNLEEIVIPFGFLEEATEYNVRAKHRAATIESGWSDAFFFTTEAVFDYILTPVVTYDGDPAFVEAVDATFLGSIFRKTYDFALNGNIGLIHTSSDWEVVEVPTGVVTEVYGATGTTGTSLTKFVVPFELTLNTEYRVRGRYNSDRFGSSAWSDWVSVEVIKTIETPTLSTTEDITEFPSGGLISGTAFDAYNETHVSTDWEVRDFYTDEILWSSYADTVNLTSLNFDIDLTIANKEVKIRAKYNGQVVNSEWSGYLDFYTSAIESGPGTTALSAGDGDAGFFGEVLASELYTGDELATELGITFGTSQHSTEPWLKFILDGKIMFVNKKPIRHSISWDDIDRENAVYGNRTITRDGYTYKVRLLTGAEADPSSIPRNTSNPIAAEVSEWNRLIYKVHVDDPSGAPWTSYNNADIIVGAGDGRNSWTQEADSNNAGYRIHRGQNSLKFFSTWTSSNRNSIYGWRAVLELVV